MGKSKRPDTHLDYINSEKYSFSLKLFLAHHPDGVPTNLAANLLEITEEEYKAIFKRVIKSLREVVS